MIALVCVIKCKELLLDLAIDPFHSFRLEPVLVPKMAGGITETGEPYSPFVSIKYWN